MQEGNLKMKIIDTKEKGDKPKTMKVKKNIMLGFKSDETGCGHIRTIFPFNYLNAVFGKEGIINPIISPNFINQQDILIKTRSILFQRQMSPEHLEVVKEYKRMQKVLKYKLIYDIDDLLWGKNETNGGDKFHGIPSYSFSANRVTDEMRDSSIEIMKNVDLVTVSTQYLKDYISKLIDTPIEVLKNTVPMYLYGHRESIIKTDDIKKPVVLYNGAPGHYSNEQKRKGDWENSWYDWVLKSVKNDEIELKVMGGLPYFLEDVKDKIESFGWVNSFQYARLMRMLKPDFVISPLIQNEFNSAKSDIKMVESYAIGAIHIGSTFSNGDVSPYDNNVISVPDNCDVNFIDNVFKECIIKDRFNTIVEKQYQVLEQTGRYTESPAFVNQLATIF